METIVKNETKTTDGEGQLAHPRQSYSTQREAGQVVKFIAHQGAQGTYPPNSLPALERAFGVADCVEFDIYVANRGDGTPEVVTIHPEGYFLYVNSQGMQNEKPLPMTFEETRSHTVAGQPLIPTVDEVLQTYLRRCQETGKRSELHIELKGPGTAEVVLPVLRKYIAEGTLSYEDFALTGLSYPGDRGRLVTARELDKEVRLVFVARGGDYSLDGFNGLDDALAFASSIRADTFTVARRGLPPADIAKIREAGFMVGTYHCRTSDEAEAANALGAEYVAADDFRGASILSYSRARVMGSPLYDALNTLGFFHTRDWIWELGWEAEKSRAKATEASLMMEQAQGTIAKTGGLLLQRDGTNALAVCEKGTPTGAILEFSEVPVSLKFISARPQEGALTTTWRELLSEAALVESTASLLKELAKPRTVDMLLKRMHATALDFNSVVALSELSPELCSEDEGVVVEVCRQTLTRYGRLLGTLGFSSLTPRHGKEAEYQVTIHAPFAETSSWIKLAAQEQVAAQGLRSGKTCGLRFV